MESTLSDLSDEAGWDAVAGVEASSDLETSSELNTSSESETSLECVADPKGVPVSMHSC